MFHDETWRLAQDGPGFVWVDRVEQGRVTSWKVERRPGKDWRVYQIIFSQENAGLDRTPARLKDYRNGFKLTDSRVDRMLRSFAEKGIPVGN